MLSIRSQGGSTRGGSEALGLSGYLTILRHKNSMLWIVTQGLGRIVQNDLRTDKGQGA